MLVATLDPSSWDIVPSSMDGIVLLGMAAAAVAAAGTLAILLVAIAAGITRRWHR